ncbi:LVIVD repeat-containing protein [Niabella hibiscisoli]|uniref:LVIVD repeat-containing protein n=1 Tax=Niabella hibiscisoli TaxID=1825928 RepID=UPI00293F0156|nr:hypothetical protein [Niabella hibiscisoli]
MARMTISGNYLYIVSSTSLYTYDITNPQTTVLLSEQPIGWGDIETIFPYRDKLFIGSQAGMYVFDNSDPKKPKLQGRAQHLRACDPVVADDDFAYVTLRNNNITCGGTINQLQVYDISGTNVLTPKVTGTLDMPEPYGLGSKGNTLYVCMGNKGLNIVNIANKAKPVSLKILTGENFIDVIPYNDLLITYVQGGIVLYDISSPTDPKKLSTIQN